MKTFVAVWGWTWVTVSIALVMLAPRIGTRRVATWLVVIGLVLIAAEEPLLTFWWTLHAAGADKDAMRRALTAQALAHVQDSAVFATTGFIVLVWIAVTAFRRAQRWAARALAAAWSVVAITELASLGVVASRGLPLPGPGGAAGGADIGWQPLLAALLAWGAGLWLGERAVKRANDRV